ncbi:MAG TPA: methylated-DNA--[protein]-cysteine S-methyltransferase [Myxococcaceae bacterium]|nr:methylated-DNA--[protein]-cysteine S-methyltransferase [Myxococcaceae bacterium]
MNLRMDEIETPIGNLRLVAAGDALCAVAFVDRWSGLEEDLRRRFAGAPLRRERNPGGASKCLEAYFAGELLALDGLRVDTGGTPFQRKVWSALRDIGVGRTASYSEVAKAVGSPSAVRAVGAANGANPIPIVIPCHRVIGTDGSLCGYGGGLERKRWLLSHEAQH